MEGRCCPVYFAVVGIVFPLVMMAIQPEAVAAWARAVVVAAFVSGLAALAWYLVRLIRRAQSHVR